ncbi:hypothetical protein D0S45_02670 [Marinifilum sp. JC120]|nr:hypothetical protein D0S45_02670 [Marinifilum sp. JC120]
MKSQKKILIVMLFTLLLCGLVSTTFASKEKSPVTCQEVGAVTVKCYDCSSGKGKYLGNVAILARYEESQGKKFCVPASEARQLCSNKFNISKYNIGYSAQFNYRASTSTEYYDTSCVK